MQVTIQLYERETEGSIRQPMSSSTLSQVLILDHTDTLQPIYTLVNGLLTLNVRTLDSTLRLVFTTPNGPYTHDFSLAAISLGSLTVDTQAQITILEMGSFESHSNPDFIYGSGDFAQHSTADTSIIPQRQF